MRRRNLLRLLAVTPATWPILPFAQQATKTYRVGLLSTSNPRSAKVWVDFERRMRELGYVEGENWLFDFRDAEGKIGRLPSLAAELVELPVDILVAPGPEAVLRAASQATDTIPIVAMAVNYDPVASGYVESLARPGRNITGVFFMQVTLSTKRLSLLKEIMPELRRVFAIYDVHSADQLHETASAARALGVELRSLELKNPPYDFDQAMATAVHNQAQALVVLSSPVFYRQRHQVTESTLKHRLPAVFLFRFFVEAGGLIAYGANLYEMYRRGVSYVDNILKGADPVDLPMEQPTTFELVVNLKTAESLGLTLPPSILLQASEVIE